MWGLTVLWAPDEVLPTPHSGIGGAGLVGQPSPPLLRGSWGTCTQPPQHSPSSPPLNLILRRSWHRSTGMGLGGLRCTTPQRVQTTSACSPQGQNHPPCVYLISKTPKWASGCCALPAPNPSLSHGRPSPPASKTESCIQAVPHPPPHPTPAEKTLRLPAGRAPPPSAVALVGLRGQNTSTKGCLG